MTPSAIELDFFGKDAIFDHVGLVVPDIRAIIGTDAECVTDEYQRVTVAFVSLHGVCTELIEPLNADAPVQANLDLGRPLAHLCFCVPDLDAAVSCGRQHGFHRIGQPVPAPAFNNRRIVWVFSRTYGLVELVER